jgi:hypothetical protein
MRMTILSPSPRRVRAASWFDLRLVLGVVLVLVSVVAGLFVVSSARRTREVWQSTHDLAAGIVLTRRDVRATAVRLADAGRAYYPSEVNVVGRALTHPVSAGELLPRSATGPTSVTATVTIPLAARDAPTIKGGDRITVWVSTKSCPAVTVLADTAVQDVRDTNSSFGSGSGQDVVVRLDPGQAQRVVQALALTGAVLRAGVLTGPAAAAVATDSLAPCAEAGS